MATHHNPLGALVEPDRNYYLLAHRPLGATEPAPLYVSLPVAFDAGTAAEFVTLLIIAATVEDAEALARYYPEAPPLVVECDPGSWRDRWATHGRAVGAVLLDRDRFPVAVHFTKGHGE